MNVGTPNPESQPAVVARRPRLLVALLVLLSAILVSSILYLRSSAWSPTRIGATTLVTEVSSGLPLEARVDTGAEMCSVHFEDIEIPNESPDPKANIGKTARLLLRNRMGESRWIEARLADHTSIRTADYSEGRYYIFLTLRLGTVEKKVLVTLNDRSEMKHPLLLGRNFLRGDFVVDVNLDNDDLD